MVVRISIPGKPVGKGRPRFSTAGGFAKTYTPKKTVDFENLVRLAWMQVGAAKLDGDIVAVIDAYFPIPKSVSKKKRLELERKPYPHKPDADNICKVILDALNNGIAYDDDAQVVSVVVRKLYSDDPRTEVTLAERSKDYNDDYLELMGRTTL